MRPLIIYSCCAENKEYLFNLRIFLRMILVVLGRFKFMEILGIELELMISNSGCSLINFLFRVNLFKSRIFLWVISSHPPSKCSKRSLKLSKKYTVPKC